MDIRIFKVREWIDEGALVTKYCRHRDKGPRRETVRVLPRPDERLCTRNGRRRQQADQCDVHILGRTAEQVKLQRRWTTAVTPTTPTLLQGTRSRGGRVPPCIIYVRA